MQKIGKLILLFLMAGLNKACGQQTFEEKLESMYRNTVPLISVEEFKNLKESKDSLYILDTRSLEEFEVSHIEGARFLSYDDYNEEDLKEIPKDAHVVLYCAVGYRSERVGEKMKSMGFDNVENLYGGIFNWKNKSMPVVKKSGQPTDSVHTYNKKWSKWLEKGTKVYD